MTRIDFFFDPTCPFCWITSRWLLQVQQEREVDVTWRPFSLAVKNGDLTSETPGGGHSRMSLFGHRVHRVISAAVRDHGASAIELYTEFGKGIHVHRRGGDDTLITEVLAGAGLPASLAQAADDESFDEHLVAETRAAEDAAGDDIGVPVIAFHTEEGLRGFFGPVLNELPSREDGLRIWDGLEAMGTTSAFYELKRTRPDGGPDVTGTDAV